MPKLKYPIHIKTPDFYKYYVHMLLKTGKGREINRKSKYFLTKSKYTEILGTINKELLGLVRNEALDFVMPARLGITCIRKYKPEIRVDEETGKVIDKMPINWKETRKLWRENPKAKADKKFIKHFNAHSNQYVGKYMWKNRHCNFTNKTAYTFIPCRTAKIELSKVFLNENREVDYLLKER